MIETLYQKQIQTPVGPMTIIGNQDHIYRIDYGTIDDLQAAYETWTNKHFTTVTIHQASPTELNHVEHQLNEYFNGERTLFDLSFQPLGTPFQAKVWKELYEIPFGETRTYKDLAIQIDKPKAVRAIGGAVNKNPLSIILPCHRVIGSNGKLVGYNGGLDKKQFLLQHENIATPAL
ncbi:methylated-DNA--[protein]-cysteine S-methyltransferase [Salinibacillus xinjiangensis]|uniref:Methylated-DNA--protein-cysteine methyltransferase n=1 Tax=Salinibacillus xinjiangensis TaxID=1229268 RepID=A0A6G1X7N5_9BACI|nr:methylated-DNA--[protein]-cysteine S-methyltransferase [Salinibacillus xinjiangensis]MRG86818.1 methylated-DNA--[protein]-cysteine S-methyltransferase [Salinibacillus xinjiangensis]